MRMYELIRSLMIFQDLAFRSHFHSLIYFKIFMFR